MSERNMNWIVLAIPDDCKSIFVCSDERVFDERIKNGLTPLHDDRNRTEGTSVPCFIGYAATSDQTDLDKLAGLQTARQVEAPKADCRTREGT